MSSPGVFYGTSFSNPLITLAGTGDTVNVTTVNSKLANIASMSVSVEGVGKTTLLRDD